MSRPSATVELKGDAKHLNRVLAGGEKRVKSYASNVGGALKRVGKMAAVAIPAIGIAVVIKSIALARVQIQAEKKLEAVIRATGGAAGFSANELKKYAADLQLVSNYGDEVTISAMAVMATFKNIKGDQFKEAIKSAQDMSAVMDTDLKSSVMQLGKALNDPIAGMAALTKVGVGFTKEQKELVKVLQESGDLMGAQGIILAELASQFGGAAAAMVDPITQAFGKISDAGEKLGVTMLPILEALAIASGDVAGAATEGDWMNKWIGFSTSIALQQQLAAKMLNPFAMFSEDARTQIAILKEDIIAANALMAGDKPRGPLVRDRYTDDAIAYFTKLEGQAPSTTALQEFIESDVWKDQREALVAANAAAKGLTDAEDKAADAADKLAEVLEKVAEAEEKRLRQVGRALTEELETSPEQALRAQAETRAEAFKLRGEGVITRETFLRALAKSQADFAAAILVGQAGPDFQAGDWADVPFDSGRDIAADASKEVVAATKKLAEANEQVAKASERAAVSMERVAEDLGGVAEKVAARATDTQAADTQAADAQAADAQAADALTAKTRVDAAKAASTQAANTLVAEVQAADARTTADEAAKNRVTEAQVEKTRAANELTAAQAAVRDAIINIGEPARKDRLARAELADTRAVDNLAAALLATAAPADAALTANIQVVKAQADNTRAANELTAATKDLAAVQEAAVQAAAQAPVAPVAPAATPGAMRAAIAAGLAQPDVNKQVNAWLTEAEAAAAAPAAPKSSFLQNFITTARQRDRPAAADALSQIDAMLNRIDTWVARAMDPDAVMRENMDAAFDVHAAARRGVEDAWIRKNIRAQDVSVDAAKRQRKLDDEGRTTAGPDWLQAGFQETSSWLGGFLADGGPDGFSTGFQAPKAEPEDKGFQSRFEGITATYHRIAAAAASRPAEDKALEVAKRGAAANEAGNVKLDAVNVKLTAGNTTAQQLLAKLPQPAVMTA